MHVPASELAVRLYEFPASTAAERLEKSPYPLVEHPEVLLAISLVPSPSNEKSLIET